MSQSPQESQQRHQSESLVEGPPSMSCKLSEAVFASKVPEKIKVNDMLVGMQHQEPVIQKVTAGAPQVRAHGQGGRESLSAETSSHQRAPSR